MPDLSNIFGAHISIRGIGKWIQFVSTVEVGAKSRAMLAFVKYIIGTPAGGLKHYVPYRYVTRAQGFPHLRYTTVTGKTVIGYRSAKQHRFVMASINEGAIMPGFPHRTGRMQRGWTYGGEWTHLYIYNPVGYTKHVMGDLTQTKMHGMIGWQRTWMIVRERWAGAIVAAKLAVQDWIDTNKPK